MIAAIFAVDEEGGFGLDNKMPWPANKDDMRWFKTKTENNIVVMGKNTWYSDMPTPLKNRINVVLSNDSSIKCDLLLSGNVESHIRDISTQSVQKTLYGSKKDVFIIGGASVIMQFKDLYDEIYITKIKGKYSCDTFINLENLLQCYTLTSTVSLGSCNVDIYRKTP